MKRNRKDVKMVFRGALGVIWRYEWLGIFIFEKFLDFWKFFDGILLNRLKMIENDRNG